MGDDKTYFEGKIKKFDGTVTASCSYLIPISNEWSLYVSVAAVSIINTFFQRLLWPVTHPQIPV